MSCSLDVLYINEDNLIEWTLMKNTADDEYVNDATVIFNILDSEETAVVENVSMPYVLASNGQYQGVLDKNVAATLERGKRYTIEIIAEASGLDGYRRFTALAKYRGKD